MDLSELQTITASFTHALQKGLRKEPTDLAFIINQLPSQALVVENETFQVMVIGGSVFKSALVKKTKNGLELSSLLESALPLFSSKESLFAFIDARLESNIRVLALNFAYPLKPVFQGNKLEGILLRGTKSHTFIGLINENICFELEQYIKKNYNRQLSVSMANDTICLLLSGLIECPPSSLAAGIVGTGLNFAFFLDDTHAVNLESGSFPHFPQSEEGKIINAASSNPSEGLFEKDVSGGYLYQHFNLLLKKQNIDFPPIAKTKELDVLASQHHDEIGTNASHLLTRSAQLVACQIAGILQCKEKNMIFVMQGSVFWKGFQYKDAVEKTVKQLVPDYIATFIDVAHADILGAAKLVA